MEPFTPTHSARLPFLWASGIEDTFIAHTRPGLRMLDEYELTQHYQQWMTDFDLLAEAGIRVVRWGIPWYRVQPEPDCWDWRWTDRALDYMVNAKGITPILDLMHYGTPHWLDNSFINASYPQRVAEYAAAVARRYGSMIRFYTPLNEPMVTVDLCGKKGIWPPYLHGIDGMLKVLIAVARGIILTTQALRAEQPDCTTVQVEAFWHFEPQFPELAEQVALNNLHQFLSFDLTSGMITPNHPLVPQLREHGVTDRELNWFYENAVRQDILGANFYPWSYGKLYRSSTGDLHRVASPTDGRAIADVLSAAYRRYRQPMMVTETSAKGSLANRSRWMDQTIGAVLSLRASGMPLIGYTWFPFFTMIDWAYRTGRRPLQDYLLHLGLYDSSFDMEGILRRYPTPLIEQYGQHMLAPIPPLP